MSDRGFQPEPEKPSYVWEMLKRPLNVNLGLGAVATATILAIPFGLAGVALPLLLFGAGEAIASMFIPSTATFRVKIDREFADKRRERTTQHLCDEISRRVTGKHVRWAVYGRLRERIESLRKMSHNRRSGLNEQDLMRLEDSCVDYLGLWLAEQSMIERQGAVDEDQVERRIAKIDEKLAEGDADVRSLKKARADLEELMLRHRRLASRRAAVEAALLSLPDAFEEIYHAVVTTPAGGDGARLQEAIDRLRLEEELESAYGDEISAIVPGVSARSAANAPTAAAQAATGPSAAAKAANVQSITRK